MKRTLLSLFATSALAILPTLSLHAADKPAETAPTAEAPASTAEKYTIDHNHSYVMWQINHLGFSDQTGKWMVDGTLLLDEKAPENSKVEVTIPVTNIVTGVAELNEHLQGPLFFDTKQFPTASFVSQKVEKLTETKAIIEGTLTVRGVAKPVTLDVTFNKKGTNPITSKQTVGFAATTMVKRSDFGMNALLPDLGDDVKISIATEAYKAD